MRARQWSVEPNEKNRRKAEAAAEKANYEGPASFLAWRPSGAGAAWRRRPCRGPARRTLHRPGRLRRPCSWWPARQSRPGGQSLPWFFASRKEVGRKPGQRVSLQFVSSKRKGPHGSRSFDMGAMLQCSFGMAPSTLVVVVRRSRPRSSRRQISWTMSPWSTSCRSACASRWPIRRWRRPLPPRWGAHAHALRPGHSRTWAPGSPTVFLRGMPAPKQHQQVHVRLGRA